MAGITDYVHYHWDKYKLYGINKDKGNNNVAKIANQEKKQIQEEVRRNSKDIKKRELQYLEEALNYCFDPKSAKENISKNVDNTYNEIWDTATRQMLDNFKLGLGDISKTGSVSTSDLAAIIQTIIASKNQTLNKLSETSQRTRISTIESRVIALTQLVGDLQTYIQNRPLLGENFQILSDGVQNIKQEFDELKKFVQNLVGINNYSTQLINVTQEFPAMNGQKQVSSLIKDINNLLAIFSGISDSLQIGELGEYLVLDAQGMLQYTASKTVYDEVKKIGNEKIYDNINITNFFPNIEFTEDQMKELGLKYADDGKTIIIENKIGTQQKIDVQYISKYNNMKISVKNYNLSPNAKYDNISVLNGSLMSALIYLNNNDFVNHYLNVAAAKDNKKDTNEANNYYDVKLIMKEALLWQGLTGYFNEGTNVFVAINNQKSQNSVKVMSIKDLFNQILDKHNSNQAQRLAQSTILINNSTIEDYAFDNTFIRTDDGNTDLTSAVSTRIINLFNQIRAGKIKVEISKDLFSEIR